MKNTNHSENNDYTRNCIFAGTCKYTKTKITGILKRYDTNNCSEGHKGEEIRQP